MHLIRLDENGEDRDLVGSIDPCDLQWIDFKREELLAAEPMPSFLSGMLHDRHNKDLSNSRHPPFLEVTEDYELLIVRSVDKRFQINNPQTRSTAFLLVDNTVVSVRDGDDDTLSALGKKWSENPSRRPRDLPELLHALLDVIADAYLELREPLNSSISDWQQKLLDPNDPFNDWQLLLQAKSSLRWLNVNLELQRDSLQRWREETRYGFSQSHQIRFNDLDGHLGRIERLSDGICADIDSLTSAYFASTGQRTNIVMQFLAVISAVFLPLNLIAGVFGMNFDHLPLLRTVWGPGAVVLSMVCLCAVLLWWFRRNRWF